MFVVVILAVCSKGSNVGFQASNLAQRMSVQGGGSRHRLLDRAKVSFRAPNLETSTPAMGREPPIVRIASISAT